MRYVPSCALALCFGITMAGAGEIEDQLSSYSDQTAAGYLAPLSEAFGQNLNTGFFTTARIAPDGFHIRVETHFMGVRYGDDDRTFQATAHPDFPSDETVTAPTIVGDGAGVEIVANGAKYKLPGGLDLNGTTIASPQLTIGSFKGTEGILRWIGLDTSVEDIDRIDLLGLGLRHSVSQYFDTLPVDIAASVMYQTFTMGDDIINGKAFSLGAQVSKEVWFLEPFASLSWDRWKNESRYTANEGTDDQEERVIDFDAVSTIHLVAGATANFRFVHIYGAVNAAERFGWSAGVALGN